MRHRRKAGIAIAACIVLAGIALLWPRVPHVASAALDEADQYELLSLDPNRTKQPSSDRFHGYNVLGKTFVGDAMTRRRLNDALRKGASLVNRPRCFNPRHCIRVTRAGRTMDFLICFECDQAQVWSGDQQIADWSTDSSPQPVFDQVLQKAGVPLPKSEE